MKAAAVGPGSGVSLDLPDARHRVPNFNLPSSLSGKLWKSMRMTPKKLECEKEFYEKILRGPNHAKVIWKCVSTCESIRQGTKPAKTKPRVKPPKVSSPSSSPTRGSITSPASMSLKAKLLAAASSVESEIVDLVTGAPSESPLAQGSPSLASQSSPMRSHVQDGDRQAETAKPEMQDLENLEWARGSQRFESGTRRRVPRGYGKRKNGVGKNDVGKLWMSGQHSDTSKNDHPMRLKLRRLSPSEGSGPSSTRLMGKSSPDEQTLLRKQSSPSRQSNEPESPESSMEMSDQALALKLHYAMNPRPSRKRQRIDKAGVSSLASSRTDENDRNLFASPESSF